MGANLTFPGDDLCTGSDLYAAATQHLKSISENSSSQETPCNSGITTTTVAPRVKTQELEHSGQQNVANCNFPERAYSY